MATEIINRLWIGDDADYDKLKDKPGWSYLRCCKEGPGGHRDVLGYTTRAAPKGKDYFYTLPTENHMALNLIDADDPNYIRDEVIHPALKFIQERLDAGDKVLVACNAGISRSPSIVLMYLRHINDLPMGSHHGIAQFKKLYPKYNPNTGMLHYVRSSYSRL